MSTNTGHRAPSAPSSPARSSPSSTIRRSKWADVQPTAYEAAGGSSRDSVMAEWVYKDAKGEEVFRLIGLESPGGRRRCRAAHVTPEGWEAGEGDGPLPLYRLDQLPAKGSKGVVFVCCSEEDADVAGVSMDLPAVTSAFGHGFARRSDWSPLAGRCVAILPENNERGRAYAAEVAQVLLELEPRPRVKVLELPGLPPGGNVFWFQDRRYDQSKALPAQVGVEVRELANQAPMYKPPVWDAGAGEAGAGAAAAVGQPVLTRLSEVEAEEVRWLWPGRVALGKLTLLYGDPNLGKSLLTLDMAARVTTGAAWPDGRGSAPQGSVVLATAEDGKKDTVPARLARAGADAARVLSLDEILEAGGRAGGGVGGATAAGGGVRRPFTLEDWRELERALEREPDVRLVVIDPVSAFLGERGGSSNAAMRALLAPIAAVAERRRVAVVMVTHITKGAGGKALHRAAGSVALIAAARAAWLAVEDPKDAGRRLLLSAKNNLADDQGGLAYRTAGGVVTWEEGPVKARADAVLAARRRRKPGPAPVLQRAAGAWLRAQLAAGPLPVGGPTDAAPGTLRALARQWKWSWAVIDRVSRKIGVVKEYCPEGRQYLWRLPPGEPPGEPPRELPGGPPTEGADLMGGQEPPAGDGAPVPSPTPGPCA